MCLVGAVGRGQIFQLIHDAPGLGFNSAVMQSRNVGFGCPFSDRSAASFHTAFGHSQVSFTITEKTTTAIVGPSGAGKTTMCNLIARFWDVNAGKITIGGTLSGGEKQRISIARAMLKDAPIIILDEATSSVDPENEDELQRAIEALTHDKTIIMIAHRLKTVRNADQILVLDNAHIVQRGTHAELIQQKGLYADFVSARQEAIGWKLAQ